MGALSDLSNMLEMQLQQELMRCALGDLRKALPRDLEMPKLASLLSRTLPRGPRRIRSAPLILAQIFSTAHAPCPRLHAPGSTLGGLTTVVTCPHGVFPTPSLGGEVCSSSNRSCRKRTRTSTW